MTYGMDKQHNQNAQAHTCILISVFASCCNDSVKFRYLTETALITHKTVMSKDETGQVNSTGTESSNVNIELAQIYCCAIVAK